MWLRRLVKASSVHVSLLGTSINHHPYYESNIFFYLWWKRVIYSHYDYSKAGTLQRFDSSPHWYSSHETQREVYVGSDMESFIWSAFGRSFDIVVHHNKWWSSRCPPNFEIVEEHHVLQLTHHCEERETCSAQKSFGWEPYTSCDILDSESFIDSIESYWRACAWFLPG